MSAFVKYYVLWNIICVVVMEMSDCMHVSGCVSICVLQQWTLLSCLMCMCENKLSTVPAPWSLQQRQQKKKQNKNCSSNRTTEIGTVFLLFLLYSQTWGEGYWPRKINLETSGKTLPSPGKPCQHDLLLYPHQSSAQQICPSCHRLRILYPSSHLL